MSEQIPTQLSLDGINSQLPTVAPKKKKVQSPEIEKRIQQLAEAKARIDADLPKAQTLIAFDQFVPAKIEEEAPPPPEEEFPPQVQKAAEPEVLTVTQLNASIKGLLENKFPMVWVKGEISNFKIPASGHLYLTLKDKGAQIRAIMFRGFAQALKFKPQDGMEVVVRCKVTVYEPRGDYQLFVEVMEPLGFGALQVAFEQLKAKLQSEGLFEQARKKKLPAFPSRVVLITSPTGAAIKDMLNVLSRRSGGSLDITIIPTSVQGDKAPGEIVKAIELANRLGPSRFDVMIVGRGGGSIEDLWAFNNESVARAVAGSKIPTISAVGHEVDFTICDFVADLRAPTPSAAAELVVKNKMDLIEKVKLLKRQIQNLTIKSLQVQRSHLNGLAKQLIDPKRRLQDLMLRCDEWTDRLNKSTLRYLEDLKFNVKLLRQKLGSPDRQVLLLKEKNLQMQFRMQTIIEKILEAKKKGLAVWAGVLDGLSPLKVLDRGYSIVIKDSKIIKSIQQLSSGDQIKIKVSDGEVDAQVKL